VLALVAVLTALAGLFHLVVTDIDAFEERTGLFDALGTLIIDGLVALAGLLAALYAASLFFPRSWGPKAGLGGAVLAALVAAFCLRVLLLGGV
jgi:hypothetical protein